ncbi:MAG: hypothetical protein ACXVBR_07190 [Flavisolibacter sp.]
MKTKWMDYVVRGRLLARTIFLLVIYVQLVSFSSCRKNTSPGEKVPVFDSLPLGLTLHPMLTEISGIADSKINPGFLWGIEDSDNPPAIFLIGHDGAVVKPIFIKEASNRDWEDMALSGGEIFIAETGDNNQVYPEYGFYRFHEPLATVDTVSGVDHIRFKYEDGSHDAEAFLVDPLTKDIYIITKRDNPSRIYKLAYPYSLQSQNIAVLAGTLPYGGVVSAAISPDGHEILIKTYPGIFLYQKKDGEPITKSLQKSYTVLPYLLEPQGESLGFAMDNTGFFTLSEKGIGSTVKLYFYKRK